MALLGDPHLSLPPKRESSSCCVRSVCRRNPSAWAGARALLRLLRRRVAGPSAHPPVVVLQRATSNCHSGHSGVVGPFRICRRRTLRLQSRRGRLHVESHRWRRALQCVGYFERSSPAPTASTLTLSRTSSPNERQFTRPVALKSRSSSRLGLARPSIASERESSRKSSAAPHL